jgi:hypothetical protein
MKAEEMTASQSLKKKTLGSNPEGMIQNDCKDEEALAGEACTKNNGD